MGRRGGLYGGDKVLEGIRLVYEGVRQALKKGVHGGRKIRVGGKGLIFGIHRRCKHLDKVGVGYASDYINLTWREIERYVVYDFYHNDLFVLGSRIFVQRWGVAIGGIISAQGAELYCMAREVEYMGLGESGRKKREEKWMPKGALLLDPYRFRDNIVGALKGKVGLGGTKVV